jgi:hypothetical protein
MEYKTRNIEIERNPRVSGYEVIRFIEDNSDMEWNDICDLTVYTNLYDDEGYERYHEYDETPCTDERKEFFRVMMNAFIESYDLKESGITVYFDD